MVDKGFQLLITSTKNFAAMPLVNWINISVHGMSFFLMIFDVIFNRMKVPIRMVVFVFMTVVFYMLMTFIIFAK
jgi:hypothetical protein